MEKEKINSGNIVDFAVLKRLLKFVGPYKGKFYFLIFLTVALGIAAPLRPLLIQLTLDNEVAAGDYAGMVNMIMLLMGLLIVQAIVQYLHTYLSGWLGQFIIRDIRVQLYKHLVDLLKHYQLLHHIHCSHICREQEVYINHIGAICA